jgi:hypothetical protein
MRVGCDDVYMLEKPGGSTHMRIINKRCGDGGTPATPIALQQWS